ncbi:hypothetical protein [Sphingobium tyrosinilyticum]|uniref:Uncharacterized protein n=1 Tax=Sphingobium tyrosinilyticum TaxID=2715436 RepID=A0ABV9EUN4_9SPHN
MPVFVEFPDGECREVPSQLRAMQQSIGLGEFEQVPLNCDPVWKYECAGTGWIAVLRKGQLLPLRPQAPAWWQFVKLMLDPERRSTNDTPVEEVGESRLQSAA